MIYISLSSWALLAAALAPSSPSAEAARPLWRGLEAGPYQVGYRVTWQLDRSRTWGGTSGLKPMDDCLYRPIRISTWYPAEALPGSRPMPYTGYLQQSPESRLFLPLNQKLNDYDLTGLGRGVRGLFKSQSSFDNLLHTPSASLLNAQPASGRFPLVVYSLGQNDFTQENAVLWEYLASHGYVVATVPHLGTSPRRLHLFIDDPLSFEAQVRDLEFVISAMAKIGFVDAARTAAVGHSMGGVYALLLAMRNASVGCVVGLDGSCMSTLSPWAYRYWEAPYFDPARLKVPVLQMFKHSEDLTLRLVESLRYADRYLLKFHALTHADFTSYPLVTLESAAPDLDPYCLARRDQPAAAAGHQLVCRYVLGFLNACLKGKTDELQMLKAPTTAEKAARQRVDYDVRPGLKAPTEEEFYAIIATRGLEGALAVYRQCKERYPKEDWIREAIVERMGLEHMWTEEPARAVDVFRFNVTVHPQSAKAYAALADAYLAAGDKARAIQNYETCLQYDPKHAKALNQLKRLRTETK